MGEYLFTGAHLCNEILAVSYDETSAVSYDLYNLQLVGKNNKMLHGMYPKSSTVVDWYPKTVIF